MGKTQHVVPHNGNWAVKGEHNVKVTKPFSRKSDATDFGRKIARNQESELVIHNRNGQISHKDSHGNDPFPPKG
ncbi:DUF2188 domain-containing protein [uncultured Acidaminococcus sp.]|jgi:hypothetical protein|uniref:DUF2188 domain-containing protein n=1 Tax=uncultured Acidaminococcus sp. TaxID=352152 RepID=UPI0025F91F28|nr:DUF2188 domain-containing protein [uncultured Acidaminococcus sp.]